MDSSTVESSSRDRTALYFWAFVLVHLLIWTGLPLALYFAPPLDSVEMYVWGQDLQWGYAKHPPLPAWIARAATMLSGGSVAGIFLASQLCVVASFWAAWQLGRSLVSPRAALLGAMLLECCLFYNYESTILNNNTVLYATWSLAILALYRALTSGQLRHWIALGVCGGLGMLTKYTFGMLPLVMLVFLLAHPQARRVWRQPGPYLAAIIALALFAPHIHWAVVNDFPPLRWAAARAQHTSGPFGRVTNPLGFGFGQLAAVLPMLLACLPLTGRIGKLRPMSDEERFHRAYLTAMVLGPFVLHLLVSAAFNLKLRSIWGSHLWTFAGVLLVFSLAFQNEPQRWRRAFAACAIFGVVLLGARVVRVAGSALAGRTPRELFDGAALASQVEETWRMRYGGTPPIIAGDGWLSGTASLYGRKQTPVFGLIDEVLPPVGWNGSMNDRQVIEAGAVFVYISGDALQESLPEVRSRFPSLELVATIEVPYVHSTARSERIAIAIVPPAAAPGPTANVATSSTAVRVVGE
jgi:4-amino-4-deoxy-L-arabinose transferase-like glycosyltransferase